MADGLREAEEELGVAWPFDALVALGAHRVGTASDPASSTGSCSTSSACATSARSRPSTPSIRAELDGLVVVGHDGFAALARGAPAPVAATRWDGLRVAATAVRAGELVPSPYLASLAGALAAL